MIRFGRHPRYLIPLAVTLAVYLAVMLIPPLQVHNQIAARYVDAHSQDYLASLYGNGGVGCRTLRLRTPRVVFLGDSHTYAGWRLDEVETLLGVPVGSCPLGALYAEVMPHLIDMIADQRLAPDLVVLGLSPRMFWESPTKASQIEEHERVLRTLDLEVPPLLEIMRGTWLMGAHQRLDASLARHAPLIENLDEQALDAALRRGRISPAAVATWRQRIGENRWNFQSRHLARAVCDRIVARGLRLAVVHIPESPFLESLYSRRDWSEYEAILGELSACAAVVVADRAPAYGLGNRHYVNRGLADTFRYDTLTEAGGDHMDPDHMNLVGATVFSRQAAEKLAGLIRR